MAPNDPTSSPPFDDGSAPESIPAGYVAGPAPVPVGGRARPLDGLLLGVAIALVAVLGGGSLFLSGYVLGVHQAGQPGTSSSDAAAFQPFWDAYHAVTTQYALGPVDQTKVVEGSIKGMVASLGDPYSVYLSPTDFQTTLSEISGQFEGIGVEIQTVDAHGNAVANCSPLGPDCRLGIVAPLDGSPALAAGLRAGDVIVSVDGKPLSGLTVDDARNLILGKAGTTVTLHIERPGAAAFNVTITRAEIQRQDVTTKDLASGSVGYIRLSNFSEAGADAFVAAVKADVAKGQKELIVDLRGNPGGFIDAAARVASAFIGSGPIFWQQDAAKVETATNAIPGGPATDPSIRVVVLVDGGSASASEIVTGALKDTGRATVVGQTTFGKGTVQTWIPLGPNGADGGVKLTIAKWLTPDRTWIDYTFGITPDVVVTAAANPAAGSDPTLARALQILATASPAPPATPAPTAPLSPASSSATSWPGPGLVGWEELELAA